MISKGHGCDRSALARIAFVVSKLIKGRGAVNASRLAREWECSTKTIHRDIDFLRDRLAHDIAYDAARYTYYYRSPARFWLIPAAEGRAA